MAIRDEQTGVPSPQAGAMWLAIGMGLVLAGMVAIVAYAGEATLAVMAVICVDGGVAGLWVLAAGGVGAWVLSPVRIDLHPALRFASSIAVGLGVLGLAILLLGLAGAWGRPVAWSVFAAGLAGGAWRLRGALTAQIGSGPFTPLNAVAWIWMIAGLSWGTMLVAGALPPGMLWSPLDPNPYDVLSYHLQVPREWYELGRIVGLEHNVFSHFPMGVEVHFLAGMELMGGPWRGMYFAQFLTGALAMVTAIGVYGIGRTLHPTSHLLPTLAGVTVACTPWLIMLGSVAYTETGLLMYATLAVGWLLIGLNNPSRLSAFVVGGALAGFACGTKYTAVPMALLAGPVAAVAATLLARLDHRDMRVSRAIAGAATFVIIGLLMFSPWLIRNAIWTGNPVFPLLMPELGQGHFTDAQVERWEVAHAPAEADAPLAARCRLLGERIAWDWQYGYVLPLAGVILGLANWRDRRAVTLLILLLMMVGIWFGFTHLQGRFAVVLIPILGILIGIAKPAVWTRAVGILTLGVVAVVGWVQLSVPLERAANVGRMGFFGIADLAVFMPEGLTESRAGDQRIALVGDVRPFIYPIPMEHLQYRTAFDVLPSADWQAAWLPEGLADLILIDPTEWHRLASTYRHIPPVPPRFQQRGTIILENAD